MALSYLLQGKELRSIPGHHVFFVCFVFFLYLFIAFIICVCLPVCLSDIVVADIDVALYVAFPLILHHP